MSIARMRAQRGVEGFDEVGVELELFLTTSTAWTLSSKAVNGRGYAVAALRGDAGATGDDDGPDFSFEEESDVLRADDEREDLALHAAKGALADAEDLGSLHAAQQSAGARHVSVDPGFDRRGFWGLHWAGVRIRVMLNSLRAAMALSRHGFWQRCGGCRR
jgi:hypothetical protein